MKTSIQKETFIEQFECYVRVMSDFVNENKVDCFYATQRSFESLLSFAYINDLLSDEEYQNYKPYEFCQFNNFQANK